MPRFCVRTACAIALWLWSALCWAVTLEWTVPTHNVDGSVLTDLAGYRIHYGNAPGELTQAIQVTGNSHEFDTLDERKPWYFAVRAYTETGAESDLSNIVSWTALPGAPSNLRITWAEKPMAITDAFTGTNGTGITAYSSNWAYNFGSGTQLQIQSNGVRTSANGVTAIAERTEASFPQEHYAQITVAAIAAGQPVGVAISCQGAGTGDCVVFAGDDEESFLATFVDGTFGGTILNIGGPLAVGNVIRLTRSGNTYTATINGSTSGAPAAGSTTAYPNGKPGIFLINDSGGASSARVDDFESTDAAGGGGTAGRGRLVGGKLVGGNLLVRLAP